MAFDDVPPDDLRRRLGEWQEFIKTPAAALHFEELTARQESARVDHDRTADARYLLSRPVFVRVEVIGDDQVAASTGDRQYGISFDDVAAVAFADLVEQTVGLARSHAGVVDARHEDRELITVTGEFDAPALEQFVRQWWIGRLQRESG